MSNSKAWIKIYGIAERTVKSRVSEIAKRSRDEVPIELSNLAQGEIAAKPDPKTGTAKPLTAVYEVIIPVNNSDLALEQGLRIRQDRRRIPHASLVAIALVEQAVQLPALRAMSQTDCHAPAIASWLRERPGFWAVILPSGSEAR